jgi:hypothetical protein
MNKKQKKINRDRFYNDMLPSIKERYKVIEYTSFIKIFIDDKTYDYYPGAQKLKRCNGTPRKEDWKEVCIDTLYNKLMSYS